MLKNIYNSFYQILSKLQMKIIFYFLYKYQIIIEKSNISMSIII